MLRTWIGVICRLALDRFRRRRCAHAHVSRRPCLDRPCLHTLAGHVSANSTPRRPNDVDVVDASTLTHAGYRYPLMRGGLRTAGVSQAQAICHTLRTAHRIPRMLTRTHRPDFSRAPDVVGFAPPPMPSCAPDAGTKHYPVPSCRILLLLAYLEHLFWLHSWRKTIRSKYLSVQDWHRVKSKSKTTTSLLRRSRIFTRWYILCSI